MSAFSYPKKPTLKRTNSTSEDDFSKSPGNEPLRKLDMKSFNKLNTNINTMVNLNLNKNCTFKYYYLFCFCRPPIILSIAHIVLTISAYYHSWSDVIHKNHLVAVGTVVLREVVTFALLSNGSDNDYYYVGNFAGLLWMFTTLYNLVILILIVLQYLLRGVLEGVDYCLKQYSSYKTSTAENRKEGADRQSNSSMSLVAAAESILRATVSLGTALMMRCASDQELKTRLFLTWAKLW